MKCIGITQRIEIIQPHGEIRDAIDSRWYTFFEACNILPILIPNHISTAKTLMEKISLDGIVFSGGNSLSFFGGEAPTRDELETSLLDYALAHHLPILGVCRGMQLIQSYFGIQLQEIKGHVRQDHTINWKGERVVVNSFHNYGAITTLPDIEVLSSSDDGVIEAIKHRTYPIIGIMWHPERNTPFRDTDIKLFSSMWG